MTEHEKWIEQAVTHTRAKRYDQARELAIRVLREDGSNIKALWIVASVTESLNERRNALNQLLRVQPENIAARQMLNSMNQSYTSNSRTAEVTYPTLRHSSQPVYFYAAIASLLLVLVSTFSAAIIF